MNNIKELYKTVSCGQLYYCYAYNKEQAIMYFRQRCIKMFGKYKLTDLVKQLPDKSWTRVEF